MMTLTFISIIIGRCKFFIPNKDNTVVIYQDKIPNPDSKKVWKEDF